MRVKWASILLIFIAFSLSIVAPVYAGTITVDTLTDGTGVAGCSLREAITRANAGSDGDDCTGVTASPNTINLSLTGSYTLTTGIELPFIATNITIQESGGATAVIEAAATVNTVAYRVFNVLGGSAALALNGVTVRNGGNLSTNLQGGCIIAQSGGDLTLTGGTVVEDCRTFSLGGAIYTDSAASAITITNSTVQNNIAGSGGGGVFVISGTLSVSGSTFANNRAGAGSQGAGGGINYTGTSFSVSSSTFSNNQAISASNALAQGGAITVIINSGGTATISGSTFTGNSVSGGTTTNRGGAINKSNPGTLNISSSVFTGNSVSGTGAVGGVFYDASGTLNVTSSRIQSNTSAGTDGDVLGVAAGATASITGSCIVNNGDNAVSDTNATILTTATNNWWGTTWGPRILGAPALSGSEVSNGDSITGSGTSAVDVGLTDDGDYNTQPTGNWQTSVPTVAGAVCMSCSGVSSVGHARVCS